MRAARSRSGVSISYWMRHVEAAVLLVAPDYLPATHLDVLPENSRLILARAIVDGAAGPSPEKGTSP